MNFLHSSSSLHISLPFRVDRADDAHTARAPAIFLLHCRIHQSQVRQRFVLSTLFIQQRYISGIFIQQRYRSGDMRIRRYCSDRKRMNMGHASTWSILTLPFSMPNFLVFNFFCKFLQDLMLNSHEFLVTKPRNPDCLTHPVFLSIYLPIAILRIWLKWTV